MNVPRAVMATISIAACALLGACAAGPRPVVQDFDTYQVINLGGVTYTTPAGVTSDERGPGYILHEDAAIPGATFRVEFDSNPPRDLGIDGDAQKRTFLAEVPAGRLASVQYFERDGARHVKILARGRRASGEALFGSLVMTRKGTRTVVVKGLGPRKLRTEIDRRTESLAESLEFGGK